MQIITDINSPIVSDFRNLKNHIFSKNNLIIMETKKVLLKYFDTNLKPYKCLITEDFYQEKSDLLNTKLNPENIYVANKKIMESIVGHNLHHGIFLIGERPKDTSLEDLQFPCLILNGVSGPENVGAIVRSCASFNIQNIIVDAKSCSPYVRRAIRVSMGNIFELKIHHTPNLNQSIDYLKKKNIKILGTANTMAAKSIHQYSFKQNCALILGSEGNGIDEIILDSCDNLLKIPINPKVNSLNIHNAASIFLYELTKQKEAQE